MPKEDLVPVDKQKLLEIPISFVDRNDLVTLSGQAAEYEFLFPERYGIPAFDETHQVPVLQRKLTVLRFAVIDALASKTLTPKEIALIYLEKETDLANFLQQYDNDPSRQSGQSENDSDQFQVPTDSKSRRKEIAQKFLLNLIISAIIVEEDLLPDKDEEWVRGDNIINARRWVRAKIQHSSPIPGLIYDYYCQQVDSGH